MSGFEILNTHKTIQVTNRERPYTLRKSGYITQSDFITDGDFPLGGVTKGIDVSHMNSPIVFFRHEQSSEDGALAVVTPSILKAPSDASWGWGSATTLVFNKRIDHSLSGRVAYYVFDDWLPPERSMSGMQLFRETAPFDIVFDADWNLMRIVYVGSIPAERPSLVPNNAPYVLNTGLPANSFAVGLSHYRTVSVNSTMGGPSSNGAIGKLAAYVSGGQLRANYVYVGWDMIGEVALPMAHCNIQPVTALAVDTTFMPIPYG